jgi:hypothetical protein
MKGFHLVFLKLTLFYSREAINPTFNFILGKHDLTQTETGEQTRTAALILRVRSK